jgi:sulfur-oxidizing protein SoxY
MGIIQYTLRRTAFCAILVFATSTIAHSGSEDAAHEARWKQLQEAIFAEREIQDGSGFIKLEAPDRAMDAALVPVAVQLTGGKAIKSVYLIVDNNPGPVAAHVTFGPRADPGTLKLRVRVNTYTNMHAVAETRDGSLYAVKKFVKASGGCSAPAGSDDAAALADIGRMKLKPIGDFTPGKPMQAQLMIRHPNFNGMQMDQITRHYTPARFIRTVDVTYDGTDVFHMESDISLSTDPVITFAFVPQEKGKLRVVARDTDNSTFEQSFEIPAS